MCYRQIGIQLLSPFMNSRIQGHADTSCKNGADHLVQTELPRAAFFLTIFPTGGTRAVGVACWPSFLMGHDNLWPSRVREPGGESPVITDWQHLLRWTPFVSPALASNCQGARNEVPARPPSPCAPTGPFVSARLRPFPRLFKLPSAKLFTPCLAAARLTTSVPQSHLSSIHIV